ARLYEALRASDALIISHHPGYPLDRHVPGTRYDALETDVERVIEIWSMHGSSEGRDINDRPLKAVSPKGGVVPALHTHGLRLGFAGGSDTHSGRPGGAVRDVHPHYGGLTGVWASSLTRRAIFEAIRARRTYALTGARMVVSFSVNGTPM